MKKTLSLVAVAAILSTSLMAAPTEKTIGLSHVDLDGNTGYGVTMSLTKLWNPVSAAPGFGVGLGYDIDVVSYTDDIAYEIGSTASYSLGLDAHAIVGYDFASYGVPVNVKAGIGYDISIIAADAYFAGISYKVTAGYKFNSDYGVELAYRSADVKLETAAGSSDSITKNTVTANFIYSF